MTFEKKRIAAVLFCILMLGFTIAIAVFHKPEEASVAKATTHTASGEDTASLVTTADNSSDINSQEVNCTPSPTATPSPSETPSPEPALSPSPSPTPELVVERLEAEKTMYVSSPVNVRMGPSTDYELCGHLNTASAVTVRGVADTGWYMIFYNEQECFVSNKYLQDTPPATPAPVQAVAPAGQPAAEAVQSANTQQPVQPAPTPAPPKVVASTIFVGDSRFVQMHEAVGETGVTWICENAKGYKWFVENAIPRIDNLVGKGTKILINLGVNDTKHADNYINMVNGKAAEWTSKGATVYYASVNPCWENPYVTNDEVIAFNAKVSANLVGVHWIDSYTFLTENGYRLVDGLHYSDDTSAVIYNYFITCIQ